MATEQGNRLVVLDVEGDDDYSRLDQFVSDKLGVTRSQAQKLIKSGMVSSPSGPVRAKDPPKIGGKYVIRASSMGEAPSELIPAHLDLDIVYEDEEIIVVNKAAGVVVHPGVGTQGNVTLIEGVLHYLKVGMDEIPGDRMRPGLVHRLDKDTSGVMVIAKTLTALNHLSWQFKEKTNLREYVAMLDGYMKEDHFEVETYLHRHPHHRTKYASTTLEQYRELSEDHQVGYRYAKSLFYKERVYGERFSLCRVQLSTGRTHQIRVHSQVKKMPIVGDELYGKKVNIPPSFPSVARSGLKAVMRQMLHAKKLGFAHPTTGKLLGFEVPLPEDFKKLVQALESSGRSELRS